MITKWHQPIYFRWVIFFFTDFCLFCWLLLLFCCCFFLIRDRLWLSVCNPHLKFYVWEQKFLSEHMNMCMLHCFCLSFSLLLDTDVKMEDSSIQMTRLYSVRLDFTASPLYTYCLNLDESSNHTVSTKCKKVKEQPVISW